MTTINALAFRDIPPDKTNDASALINLARNFGGSIGIAFASTLLTRREQFHQSRLVEQLQGLNPAYTDFTDQVGSALGSAPDSATTLANIYNQAVQQSQLLSYLDGFKALALLFLALLATAAAGQTRQRGLRRRSRPLIETARHRSNQRLLSGERASAGYLRTNIGTRRDPAVHPYCPFWRHRKSLLRPIGGWTMCPRPLRDGAQRFAQSSTKRGELVLDNQPILWKPSRRGQVRPRRRCTIAFDSN